MPTRSRNLNLNDIDTYRALSDAQVHRDGSVVAFVVSALTHPHDKTPRANIWMADTRGNPAKPFTTADACEMHPQRSPDEHHITFVSSLWSDRGIISGDVYMTDTNGKNTRCLSEGY